MNISNHHPCDYLLSHLDIIIIIFWFGWLGIIQQAVVYTIFSFFYYYKHTHIIHFISFGGGQDVWWYNFQNTKKNYIHYSFFL